MQYHQKHSGLTFFDEVVNEDEFLEFLIEWSDSIVSPENMVNHKTPCSTCTNPSVKSTGHHRIIKRVISNRIGVESVE